MPTPEHKPVIVYDKVDPEKIMIPAEVCEACSDWEAGVWVPAPFCEQAKALLPKAPWER